MAIPFALIPGAIAAGQSIYNFIQGAGQRKKANEINPIRPKYQTPGEIGANRELAQNLANTSRIPGQGIIENRLRENSANALNAVMKAGGSSSNILNAASQINQNQNEAFGDLAIQGAQLNLQNQDRLMDANQTVARYKDQAFDYNQNQPYLQALSRKYALEEAGAQNINNALTGLTNVTSSFVGSDMGLGVGKKAKTLNNQNPVNSGTYMAPVGLRSSQFRIF